MAIKSLGGGHKAVVGLGSGFGPRAEVVEQSPSSTMQICCLLAAVQVLAILEVPVHLAHYSVQHVARAVAAFVVVCLCVFVSAAAQLLHLLQHYPAEVLQRPLTQPPQSLPE